MTTDDARIIAASNDIYRTDDPAHLAFQKRNRARGRMAGQIRLRIRYRQYATPWFDYLLASLEEMAALAESAGWPRSSAITVRSTSASSRRFLEPAGVQLREATPHFSPAQARLSW